MLAWQLAFSKTKSNLQRQPSPNRRLVVEPNIGLNGRALTMWQNLPWVFIWCHFLSSLIPVQWEDVSSRIPKAGVEEHIYESHVCVVLTWSPGKPLVLPGQGGAAVQRWVQSCAPGRVQVPTSPRAALTDLPWPLHDSCFCLQVVRKKCKGWGLSILYLQVFIMFFSKFSVRSWLKVEVVTRHLLLLIWAGMAAWAWAWSIRPSVFVCSRDSAGCHSSGLVCLNLSSENHANISHQDASS